MFLINLLIKCISMRAIKENKGPKYCENCSRGELEPKQMNLFSQPNVFSFAIHWIDPDDTSREDIRKIFKFITPIIQVNLFMKVETKDAKLNNYILRGFISYYGKHYMAYFYSELHDYWIHLNDSKITKVGNFSDVIEMCVKGNL